MLDPPLILIILSNENVYRSKYEVGLDCSQINKL